MSDILLNEAAERLEQYTFSACSLDKRFDESIYINEVVRHTECNAHYTYPDFSGLTDQLDLMTWHQDEPFGSTSIYAQWSVCKLAAEKGIKVLLDGQGADEQLAGYRGYFGARFVNLFIRMKWWQLAKEIRAMSRTQGKGLNWAIKYIADALLPSWLRYALRKMIGRETIAPEWLNMGRLKATPIDPVRESGKAFHSIKELSFRQLTSNNLQMLLHWEDRNSMAHSIEARVPFLDRRLVEFNLGLPDEYKLSDGVTKRVLRSGLSEILPMMISTRMSKLGFATPEEVWVRQLAPEYFRQAVKDAIETTGGILNPEALKIAEDVISGKRPFDFLVWRLISYAHWMKCFNVSLQ
jgi:asparagine synthase (glutamine-hydrolysing)